MLSIAHDIRDRTLEARAYAGLGHAARSKGDHAQAKTYHEQQLDNALQTKDKVSVISLCEVILYTHAAFTESKCTSTAQHNKTYSGN